MLCDADTASEAKAVVHAHLSVFMLRTSAALLCCLLALVTPALAASAQRRLQQAEGDGSECEASLLTVLQTQMPGCVMFASGHLVAALYCCLKQCWLIPRVEQAPSQIRAA